MKIYQKLASCRQAMTNCHVTGNTEWYNRHAEAIERIVKEHMPSGSGWDCGTKFDFDASTPEKLVFTGSFHHMDEWGGYDGWTDHTIIVTPSLTEDVNIEIKGDNRNDIDDLLYQWFVDALCSDIVGVKV